MLACPTRQARTESDAHTLAAQAVPMRAPGDGSKAPKPPPATDSPSDDPATARFDRGPAPGGPTEREATTGASMVKGKAWCEAG